MPIESWNLFPEDFKAVLQSFRKPEVGWDMLVNQNLFVEQVLPGAIVRQLSETEMECYREPFKDPASRKSVWRWPNELPIEEEPKDIVATVEAYNQFLQKSDLPKLLFYSGFQLDGIQNAQLILIL